MVEEGDRVWRGGGESAMRVRRGYGGDVVKVGRGCDGEERRRDGEVVRRG